MIIPKLVTLFKNRKIWIFLYFLAIGIYVYLVSEFVGPLAERLGFISIGIAFISMFLAFKSDTLINIVANSEFRRIIGQIEDIRLELPEMQSFLDFETGKVKRKAKIYYKSQISTWKCQTYADAAIDILLKSDIKPGSVSRFLNLINNYVTVILNVRNQFNIEIVINIISIYKRIYSLENSFIRRDLERFEFESRKNDSITLIRDLTGIGADVEVDLDFVNKYKAILTTFISEGTTLQEQEYRRWKLPFSSVRKRFNSQF